MIQSKKSKDFLCAQGKLEREWLQWEDQVYLPKKKLKSQDWAEAEYVASNRRSRRMLASKKFEHSEERAK